MCGRNGIEGEFEYCGNPGCPVYTAHLTEVRASQVAATKRNYASIDLVEIQIQQQARPLKDTLFSLIDRTSKPKE